MNQFSGRRRSGRSVSVVRVMVLLLLAGSSSCRGNTAGNRMGERWLQALNSHDPQRIVELLHDSAEFQDPVVPKPLNPSALTARLTSDWKSWKDRRYTARTIDSTGDAVIVEWHIDQTHPSGTPVPLDGLTLLQLVDGKIYRVREYYDAAVYLPFLKSQ